MIEICTNNAKIWHLSNHGVAIVNFAGIVNVAPNKLKAAADISIDINIARHEHIKPRCHVQRV